MGGAPEPEPLPPDVAMTEAEVRAFLGVDPEILAFLEAEAEAERAAAEADSATTSDDLLHSPTDPALFDIPIHYNERVEFWMNYFRDRDGERFGRYLARLGRYGPYIRAQLRERGMPEDLVYLALIESGLSPVARSHAAAVGLWQFIAGTGRRYGLRIDRYIDERRDPVKSTEAALDYLQDLYKRFGSWYLAAAAYNTGEGRVERVLRRHADGQRGDDALFWEIAQHLPRETRNYVPKLIAAAILAKNAEAFGFGDVVPEAPFAFDVVSVPDATDLEVIAEAAGVEVSEIQALNPQFLRGVTPPGRKVEVRVPAGYGDAFEVAYAKIPPSRRVRVLEHTVRRGETLSHIARRYGTTIRELQQANRIRDPHAVRAGQRLVVRLGPDVGTGATNRASSQDEERTSAPAQTASPNPREIPTKSVYVVRPGDSLWMIARRHGVGVDQLRAWNQLGSGDHILPGQELVIRPETRVVVYQVRPGDSLWSIARRHGVTMEQLIEWNDLGRDAVLRPGDRVEVPLGGR